MGPRTKKIVKAFSYFLFFILSFVLSLYLTFDPQRILPWLEVKIQASVKGISKVKIEEVDKYLLSGLSLKGLEIQFQNPQKDGSQAKKLSVDKLKFRLKTIPLLIGRKSVSFSALCSGGKLEGDFSKRSKGFNLFLKALNLELGMVPFDAFTRAFSLAGKTTGKLEIEIPDETKPESWNGELELKLAQGRIQSLNISGIGIKDIDFSQGEISLKLKKGKAKLETIKIQSNDFPIELSGEVEFRFPINQSFIQLEGKLNPSQAYLDKMPVLRGLLPSDGKFSYKGTLTGFSKMP